MNCEQFQDAYLCAHSVQLDAQQKSECEAHLQVCVHCKAEYEQMQGEILRYQSVLGRFRMPVSLHAKFSNMLEKNGIPVPPQDPIVLRIERLSKRWFPAAACIAAALFLFALILVPPRKSYFEGQVQIEVTSMADYFIGNQAMPLDIGLTMPVGPDAAGESLE